MFGPNTHYTPVIPRNYSHRSEYAVELAGMVKHRLKVLFGLCDYDILLIPGPATVAMQMVIECNCANWVVIGSGKFADRWRGIASHNSTPGDYFINMLYCQLETSTSCYTKSLEVHDCAPFDQFIAVDAVSGWPFYRLPKNCNAFVTTSCKQLGAPPGIAIIGVRKDSWGRFGGLENSSYTNIQNHRDGFYTTAPVNVLEVLEQTLTAEYFLEQNGKIEAASRLISGVIPPELTIGERTCPVITVRRKEFDQAFPGIAQKFNLYPETCPDSPTYHIFTYSEPFNHYVQFVNALKYAAKH